MTTLKRAERDANRCTLCEACEELLDCPRFSQGPAWCTGCGACAITCPNTAVRMVDRFQEEEWSVMIDGRTRRIPDRITALDALRMHGCAAGFYLGDGTRDVPCGVGGCGSCAVLIDGEIQPACVTPVRDGMEIGTVDISRYPPRRRIQGWAAHGVGGVGTPWQMKRSGRCIEVAAFTCGCNLRCPQCQNWRATYNGRDPMYTPHEAAVITTAARRRYGVDRMAVSGGECTLNRRWLASYIRELREMNPDQRARFHVDTNATLLSLDYIDELVAAGMTDIGPDLKGLTPETFMRITGLSDRDTAARYLETSWEAVRYIVERYPDDLFIGIGIPYNRALISREELEGVAEAIARIDTDIQVCVLDYRPQFRRTDLIRPGIDEMRDVGRILRGAGLTTVICQTSGGHLGPV